jgi:hypothetical protein
VQRAFNQWRFIGGCRPCTAMFVCQKRMIKDWCRQLHDNTCLHAANIIKTKVQHMRWEVLEHLAYSPDLSPPATSTYLGHWSRRSRDADSSRVLKWNKLLVPFSGGSLRNCSWKASSAWWLSGMHVWIWVVTLFEWAQCRYYVIGPQVGFYWTALIHSS